MSGLVQSPHSDNAWERGAGACWSIYITHSAELRGGRKRSPGLWATSCSEIVLLPFAEWDKVGHTTQHKVIEQFCIFPRGFGSLPALPAALLSPTAGESGWLTEPSVGGCSWMAQAHAQQPPLIPYLVLQKTWELEWWNEEEVTLEFLYTWLVGALNISKIHWFCRCFHATLINSVSSSFH